MNTHTHTGGHFKVHTAAAWKQNQELHKFQSSTHKRHFVSNLLIKFLMTNFGIHSCVVFPIIYCLCNKYTCTRLLLAVSFTFVSCCPRLSPDSACSNRKYPHFHFEWQHFTKEKCDNASTVKNMVSLYTFAGWYGYTWKYLIGLQTHELFWPINIQHLGFCCPRWWEHILQNLNPSLNISKQPVDPPVHMCAAPALRSRTERGFYGTFLDFYPADRLITTFCCQLRWRRGWTKSQHFHCIAEI